MEQIIFYAVCLIAGVIGILLQALFKIQSLKKKAKAGNVEFSTKQYFQDDFIVLLTSFVIVIAAVFLLGDKGVKDYEDWYTNWPRACFILLGYSANDFGGRVLGQASAKINSVIDKKTDIADGKTKSE